MFNTVTLYETCILMSGDGDFERALELVRSKGKRIAVVAHPEMTARELRNVAGRNYFDLRDLERAIARTDRLPDPSSPAGTYGDMEEEEDLEEPTGPPTHAQVNVWRSTTISAQTTRPERY